MCAYFGSGIYKWNIVVKNPQHANTVISGFQFPPDGPLFEMDRSGFFLGNHNGMLGMYITKYE
jgi:hypothetical protein